MKTCPICKSTFPQDFSVCPRDGVPLRGVTELEEGTVIRGKYQIVRLLGRGGMGSVYQAKHLVFNETCALKVVRAHLLEEPEFLKRFRAEAVLMRRLRHPNAVQVNDVDETEDGRPFIVMEYVEGRSLDEVLEQEGPLEWQRATRLAGQVCAALGAAHQAGIIHRDVKPSNILLTGGAEGQEVAKVLDFGVAKAKEKSATLNLAHSLTGTGFAVGTPAYMSPEQAKGKPGAELDGRSDLYSLGVVLYEMLTGRLPFQGDTPVMLMLAHVHNSPIDPRSLRADLPEPLAELILRALAKEPAGRPAHAEEMRTRLHQIIERPREPTTTTSPAPVSTPTPAPAPAPTPAPRPSKAEAGTIPCPLCGEPVRPTAKKCPHCREFLDEKLRAEREREVQVTVKRAVAGPELDDKVSHSYFVSIVGMVVFFAVGAILGPAVILYAWHYKKEYERLSMPPHPKVKGLFIIGIIWFLLGTVGLALFIWGLS